MKGFYTTRYNRRRTVLSGSARAAFDLGGHYTCCDQPDTEKALEYLLKSASLG